MRVAIYVRFGRTEQVTDQHQAVILPGQIWSMGRGSMEADICEDNGVSSLQYFLQEVRGFDRTFSLKIDNLFQPVMDTLSRGIQQKDLKAKLCVMDRKPQSSRRK